MQENNSTQHDSIKSEDALTASDIEYARRNGLSSSDMLAFKEENFREQQEQIEQEHLNDN